MKTTPRYIGSFLVALLAIAPLSSAVSIDETSRTVHSTNLLITWSGADQEAIVGVRWDAGGVPGPAPNLTSSSDVGRCSGSLAPEYWGNSWEAGAPQAGEEVLVGVGTTTPTGDVPWAAAFGQHGAEVSSQSSDCNVNLNAAEVPVRTRYRFYDHGPRRNVIRLDRTFSFEDGPFNETIRPYMPRVSLAQGFLQVLYPSTADTLASLSVFECPVGCTVSNWDPSRGWYAIENPATGQGLILQRAENGHSARLWVDWDGASFTNATSFQLVAPQEGFAGEVIEREVICFYDSTIWSADRRQALALPAGCSID